MVLKPLIGKNSRERDAFIDIVYDTRNYLTHYTEELEKKAATGEELFYLTECLSIALQVCFLRGLSTAVFDSQRCVEVFRKHELYQFLCAGHIHLNLNKS